MKSSHKANWNKVAALVFSLVVLLAASGRSAQAQETQKPNPEVEQLKEKLQKLEQTVEELKKQLAGLEQPRIAPAAAKPEQPRLAPITARAEAPSAATSTAKVDAPGATTSTESPRANVSKGQEEKKGENTFQVYGFAMLDMGYDFKQNDPNWFDVIRPTKLPNSEKQFGADGNTYFGVRQSRLGVKSTTATKFGELKTQFEFELFGTGVDAGQTTFRLRHAYGELGPVGAGQTWSPFMDIDVFPNSVEYWGPNGMVFFRNVQVRWMPLKGNNAITIALERPGASGDQGVFQDRIELQGIKPHFDLPDLSGNVRFTRGWGHVQIAGIVRQIKWVDTTNDQFNLNGHATGWGFNLTSNFNFSKNDIGRFAVVYGHGIENYMNDAPVDIGIERGSTTDPTRPIRGTALPVLGVVTFLDHNWNKKFSSSIGYSLVNIENSEFEAANAYHRGQYGLTNLLFYPYENVMVGGEFQWGRRANFGDGFAVNDYRIQFSFRYNFSRLFSL